MTVAEERPRRAVYTILFGDYEELLPQPALVQSVTDAFCFTDDPSLQSDEWTVVHVGRRLPGDVVRSQRAIKVCFFDYLADYDEVLYIDNSVRLKQAPEKILDYWLAEADMALFEHSFRDRLIDEFDEVARLNYDDAVRVHEQLWDYARTAPEVLDAKPLWTGMMARRNTPEVRHAMQVWYENVLRYSRRDQLSVLVALRDAEIGLHTFPRDNSESEWHSWAMSSSRNVPQGKRPPLPSGPMVAELVRSQGQLEDAKRATSDLQHRFDEASRELEEARSGAARAADLENQVKLLAASLEELRNSRSWRITAPIRKLIGLRSNR